MWVASLLPSETIDDFLRASSRETRNPIGCRWWLFAVGYST